MTAIQEMAERLRMSADMLADNLWEHEDIRLNRPTQLDRSWHADPNTYEGNRTKDALMMQIRILRGLLLDIRDQLNVKEDDQ